MRCDLCGANVTKTMDTCAGCGTPVRGKAERKAKPRTVAKRAAKAPGRPSARRRANGARVAAR